LHCNDFNVNVPSCKLGFVCFSKGKNKSSGRGYLQ